jgi:uncharacterized protein (TIGR02246 family)
MRRNLNAAVLSTLFLFTFAAHAAAPEQSSGAQAVDEAWRKAMSANDLDAVVACYSKDAVLWLAGAMEAKGREAIRKAFALVLNANTVTEVTFANTHYETAANLSVGWGDYSIALVPKAGGNPVVLSGRFTVVAKQEDGKWVYIIDHASPRPVPEEPGK